MYDYLVVGAGLAGAVFARCMTDKGRKCLVLERRPHIAGNVYNRKIEGIDVHMYGPHIFHTGNKEVWDYVNALSTFNRYTNSPIANYYGEIYNMPFNMNNFNKMFDQVHLFDKNILIFMARMPIQLLFICSVVSNSL